MKLIIGRTGLCDEAAGFLNTKLCEINGQNPQSVCLTFLGDDVFKRIVEFEFAERDFDLQFPNARCAEKNLICRIENFRRDFERKFMRLFVHPDESVGIQQ